MKKSAEKKGSSLGNETSNPTAIPLDENISKLIKDGYNSPIDMGNGVMLMPPMNFGTGNGLSMGPPAGGFDFSQVSKVIEQYNLHHAGKTLEGKEVATHCAFCLDPMASDKLQRCSKCRKRAYCSRKCQTEDWSTKGKGQGHKNWCCMEYGEESVDWKIVQIEGKGKGIISLRKIPAHSRIMVDGFRMPSLTDANANDIWASLGQGKFFNHACDPNASRFPILDKGLGVLVVFAERDIEEGEEICVNYTLFSETSWQLVLFAGNATNQEGWTPKKSRKLLKSKYSIICPSDCFCRTEGLEEDIALSRTMNEAILATLNGNVEDLAHEAEISLQILVKLLVMQRKVKSMLFDRIRILGMGFEIAVRQKKTLPLAMEFVTEAYEMLTKILHPQVEYLQKYEKWMKDPASHEDYLKFETIDKKSCSDTAAAVTNTNDPIQNLLK